MKKIYTILLFFVVVSMAKAAIIPITVQASSFSPSTVNALCNDTIIWIWGQSGSHTTTSTTIPSCATAWDNPISATSFSFAITVPCAGTYNYVCTPHSFTGVITVTCLNSVVSVDNEHSTSAYPNPFSGNITVETSGADMISIYNAVGEKIKTITLQKGQTKAEIFEGDLREGIYFYSIIKGGAVIETKKIIKE